MRVLFCGGSPSAASWQMRAVQIAQNDLDWQAISDPSQYDIEKAEAVVLVKRSPASVIEKLKPYQYKKPIIWDALDFWPQGVEMKLPQTPEEATTLLEKSRPDIDLAGLICANRTMAEDCYGITPSTTWIYHQARLDAAPLPFGKVAYYDGAVKHATEGLTKAAVILGRKGWELRVGKPEGKAGIMLAIRDESCRSYLAWRWKSNVKAANALACRLPIFSTHERGALETLGVDCPEWLSGHDEYDFTTAFKQLDSPDFFALKFDQYNDLDKGQFTLPAIYKRYQEFLGSVL